MRLMKYTINLPADKEEIVSACLYDCGIDGIEIEDSLPLDEADISSMFIDIPPETDNDGSAKINFYLDIDDAETDDILKRVSGELSLLKQNKIIDSDEITVTDISSVNWQDNWKKYFKEFSIDNVHIIPAWEENHNNYPENDIIIKVDPGSAFGTGKHETTQLCIKELNNYIKGGESILDIGTGSGILGIIALKMQAKEVVAVDIDENIKNSVRDNLLNNDIKNNQFHLKIGDIANDAGLFNSLKEKKYSIILANILPPILRILTPYVRELMNKDTVYILSGILCEKESEVDEFLKENHLQVISKNIMGEWMSIVAKLI